ncbi:MAG: Xanthine dehydrogenase iron-sulfur subunit, partial [uncultured Rubrobacteraceae bacterium]
AHTVHGERGGARGGWRLGGREPAVRPTRAPRAARLQERLRAGRVRLVFGVPGRHARVLVPGLGRTGPRTRDRDGRGAGRGRRPRPGAGGLRGGRRGAVRVLHARLRRGDPRPAHPEPAAERRGDKGGSGGEPVPLHRLREDPGRRPPRRHQDGRM